MEVRTGSKEGFSTACHAEEASAWDARLRAPDCTDDDRVRFAAWRDADPLHAEAFELVQTIVASLDRDRGRAEVRSLRADALRVVSARQNRRRIWWGAIAASVIAASTCAALWSTPIGRLLSAPILELAARLNGGETYATGLGQRSTFVLEDGSSVELNAESRIKVLFTKSRRDVELMRGQAFFSVAKNTQRPFIVHAGNREITAVGTQFDVRLDSHSVQVTLLEGKVRVQSTDAPPAVSEARARTKQQEAESFAGTAEVITLTPGKQLIARMIPMTPVQAGAGKEGHGNTSVSSSEVETSDAQGTDTVRDIDLAKVTGWRDGRVILEDQPLEDALEEMNKHSVVQIRIGDESLAHLRINGMFPAGEQDDFVTALEAYFPISAERRGDREIVLTSRH
jgi:transmembrane sensor